MNSSALMWGVIFGSIGMAYFIYGKKQRRGAALLSGFALIVLPYVVSNVLLLVLLGIALMALPYFVRY
jgi:hypothetical protein